MVAMFSWTVILYLWSIFLLEVIFCNKNCQSVLNKFPLTVRVVEAGWGGSISHVWLRPGQSHSGTLSLSSHVSPGSSKEAALGGGPPL